MLTDGYPSPLIVWPPRMGREHKRCRGCDGALLSLGSPAPDYQGVLCMECWEVVFPPAKANEPYEVREDWRSICLARNTVAATRRSA